MTVRETAIRRRLVRVAGRDLACGSAAMTSAGTLRTEVYTLV